MIKKDNPYGNECYDLHEWHKHIFQVLMRYREKHPEFTFALRPPEKSTAHKQDFWFMGNDMAKSPTIIIGLTGNFDTVQKMYSIGISLVLSKPSWPDTSFIPPPVGFQIQNINLIVVCKTDKNLLHGELFNDVLKSIDKPFSGWNRIYSMQVEAKKTIEMTILNFIDSKGLAIQQLLSKYSSPGFYITPDEFNDSVMKLRLIFGENSEEC